MSNINRRIFVAGSLACACSVPHSGGALAKMASTKSKKSALLNQLSYGSVSLLDGPMRTQFDHQHALYRNLDLDMLLKPFRQRAGMAAPGEDMGGWYDDSRDFVADPNDWSTANFHGYIPGHSFGQYISGLSRAYAATGDAKTKERVAALLAAFGKTLSPKFFEGYFLPAYTYDKLVVGLIDAFTYCGFKAANTILDKLTDIVLPFLPEKALSRPEMRARPHKHVAETWDETYTLPENLFLAYSRGMGERYRDLAVRFIPNDIIFDALASGSSPLGGQHGYSHVNSLSSAMQSYFVIGEDRYLRAAKNGFQFVEQQSFATGGWAPDETLYGPDDNDRTFESLSKTHNSFETPCGAYGHFKITRYLLQVTGESRYGDSMERVLYNTILGARPTTQDGRTFYYSDYNQDAKKVFHGDKWPCCSGTFIQLAADYGISSYLFDANRLMVNLYVPSTVKAKIAGREISVRQETSYPFSDSTKLTLDMKAAARFSLSLRIPKWAGPKTAIRINGEPWKGTIKAATFAEVSRMWRKGDVVEIQFDMGLRLEPLNAKHQDMVAVMTGPLVLFPTNDKGAALSRTDYLSATREGPDTWVVRTKDRNVTLKPFMSIENEPYRLYSPVVA